MSKQIRRQHQRQPSHQEQEQAQAPAPEAGGTSAALEEEVACCLAEIDQVLQEADAERKAAEEAFRVLYRKWTGTFISREAMNDKFRIWSAQYAHLGLQVVWCCGSPVLLDAEGNRV